MKDFYTENHKSVAGRLKITYKNKKTSNFHGWEDRYC